MEYFQVRYNSRVVIYDHKMFIRLAMGPLMSEATALPTATQSLPINVPVLYMLVTSIAKAIVKLKLGIKT